MIKSYKNWINNSYSQIKENYVEINNLDQKLGDGDHGSTILKGLDAAVANLNIIPSEDLIFFMSEISKLMRISMGGASGILMTIFIKEVGNINYDNLRLSILDILYLFLYYKNLSNQNQGSYFFYLELNILLLD